jgi:hypothetical protein
MKKIPSTRNSIIQVLALTLVIAPFAPAAIAQVAAQPVASDDMHKATGAPKDATAMAPLEQPMEEEEAAPLQVGDATQNLLAWQSSGEIASKTPRPIAGAVAVRSYERYLKSFEYPIPERLNSSVKKASSSTGSQ